MLPPGLCYHLFIHHATDSYEFGFARCSEYKKTSAYLLFNKLFSSPGGRNQTEILTVQCGQEKQ